MKTNPTALTLCLLLGSLAAPAILRGQDAAEILDTAFERHLERIADVENYTLVMEVMGTEMTSYFEKESVDDVPAFRLVESSVEGMEGAASGGGPPSSIPYAAFREIADGATVEGREAVDGEETWVIQVADFSGVELGAGGRADFTAEEGTFYLDTDQHVMRKMILEGAVPADGTSQPFTMTIHLADYRKVDGMLYPFETRVSMQGAMASSGMSEEEIAEAQASLAEMEEQLASMPAEQREMMEEMMGAQFEQLRKMVASGSFEVTAVVKDLRVNAGPPSAGGR